MRALDRLGKLASRDSEANAFLLSYALTAMDPEARAVAISCIHVDSLDAGQKQTFEAFLNDAEEEIRLAAIEAAANSRDAVRLLSDVYRREKSPRLRRVLKAALGKKKDSDRGGTPASSFPSKRDR